MSNKAIAERVLEVMERVENGELSAVSLSDSVDLHIDAFEGLDRDTIDCMHTLSVNVLNEDLSTIEEEMLGMKSSNKSLLALRKILTSL